MKKLILWSLVALSFIALIGISVDKANAYVSVKGHYRNGTYVAPHVRSNPNGLKYDNYGYKPSQGLYNPSYGTKGANWNTPTYITDPDYYTGKSLYESGSSGSYGSTVPSSPSVLPIYNSSSYESVTGGYKSYGILFCDYNYYKSSDRCIKIPRNSISSYDSYYCKSGYVKEDDQCIELPENAEKSGESWKCKYGYNKSGDSCNLIENMEIKTGSGYPILSCKDGYIWNESACYTYTQNCQLTYGRNSDGDKNYCQCTNGYEWNSDKTQCVEPLVCSDDNINWGGKCITLDQSCQNSFGLNAVGVIGGKKSNTTNTCNCKEGYTFSSDMKSCVVGIATIQSTKKSTSNTLKIGSKGDEVKGIQSNLIKKGYLKSRASGTFDLETSNAVKLIQAVNGLKTDGLVGPKTLSLINK